MEYIVKLKNRITIIESNTGTAKTEASLAFIEERI